MRRTKEDAEITRQLLLKAGKKVFSEKGYSASRLSEVAEEAGVTRGAIYWHFKNKKELFIALFKDTLDPFFDTIKNVYEKDLSPLEKIKNLMSDILNKINDNAEFRANMSLEFTDRRLQRDIPELSEYVTSRSEKLYRFFIKIVIAGIERGEIRKDMDPDSVISMFVMLIRGYVPLISQEGLLKFFRNVDSSQITDIFIAGIRA